MLTCLEATKLLSQQQDHKLLKSQRLNLIMHTAWCSGCRNFGKHIKILSLTSKQFCMLPNKQNNVENKPMD